MFQNQVFLRSYLFQKLLTQSDNTRSAENALVGGLWIVEKIFRDKRDDVPRACLRALNTSNVIYVKRDTVGTWTVESTMLPPGYIKKNFPHGSKATKPYGKSVH